VKKIKEAGFDGTEIILPYEEDQKALILETANNLGLEIIAQWGGFIPGDFDMHLFAWYLLLNWVQVA